MSVQTRIISKNLIFEGKPPLYFQLAGIACKIFGVNEFSVRFPALLSALCILLIIFLTARKLRDEETAVKKYRR